MRFLPILMLLTAFSPSARAQGFFDAPLFIAESEIGAIRAVADVDNDGDEDLIWIDFYRVQTYLNDGTGDFTPGPVLNTTGHLIQSWPFTVVHPEVGDVNGDTIPDIVLAVDDPYPHATIRVLFGLPGGAFAQPLNIDLSGPPPATIFGGGIQEIILGQLDSDPELEIAEAHSMAVGTSTPINRTEITWWDWNGAAFVPSTPLTLDGNSPIDTVLALGSLDVDQDGDDDLIASGTNGNIPAVIVIPTVGGSPTAPTASMDPGVAARSLTVADIDGDTDEDVVLYQTLFSFTIGFDTLRVTVLENQGGSFLVKPSPDILDGAASGCAGFAEPTLGDWDGDGDIDSFYVCADTVYLENTNNTFTETSSFRTEPDKNIQVGFGIIADLDLDGNVDFAGSRIVKFGDGLAPTEQPITGFSTNGILLDWEGDGDIDLLGLSGKIDRNDATGNFTPLPSRFPPPPPGNFSFTRTNVIGDFTGDGKPDELVRLMQNVGPFNVIYAGAALLADDGSGKLQNLGNVIPSSIHPGFDPYDGRPRKGIDIDLDGDLDFAVSDGILRNNGQGLTWTYFPGLFSSTDVVDTGDFDQDGWIDLLSRTDDNVTATRTLHRNLTAVGFPQFGTLPVIGQPAEQLEHRTRFLDFDGDGDLDIIAPGQDSTIALFAIENVGGQPATAAPFGQELIGDTSTIGLTDLDGDGQEDLVLGRAPLGSGTTILYYTSAYRRLGPGFLSFGDPSRYLTNVTGTLIDIDEDGDDDVVGYQIAKNREFDGIGDGVIRQYGAGTSGTGNAEPVLGANGPVRPGSTTASLRVRRALGGAPSLLVIGTSEAALPGVINGTSLYVNPPLTIVSLVLPGTPGSSGDGTLTLDLSPFLAQVAGLSVFHQLVVIDPAGPGGYAASGGLEITYGL